MHRVRFIVALLVLVLAPAAVPAAAAPALTVVTPANGSTIMGDAVRVEVQVADLRLVPSTVPLSEAGKRPEANRPGEGHLHFMLDLSPLVVWDKAEPYTFTNVPAGEHQLMVELANNDHSPLNPRVTQTIRFSVTPAMPRSGAGGGAPALPAALGLWLLIAGGGVLGVNVLRRQRSRRLVARPMQRRDGVD